MSAAHRVGRRVRVRLLQDSRKGRLPLLPLSGTRSTYIALKQGLSPKLYANYTETSLLGFAPPVLCRRWPCLLYFVLPPRHLPSSTKTTRLCVGNNRRQHHRFQ